MDFMARFFRLPTMLAAVYVTLMAGAAVAKPPPKVVCGPGDDADLCAAAQEKVDKAAARKATADRARAYVKARETSKKFVALVASCDLDGDDAADDKKVGEVQDWDVETLYGVITCLEDDKMLSKKKDDDFEAKKPSQYRYRAKVKPSAAKKALRKLINGQRALATDDETKLDYIAIALRRLGGGMGAPVTRAAAASKARRGTQHAAGTPAVEGSTLQNKAGECLWKRCNGDPECAEKCLSGEGGGSGGDDK